MYYCYACVNKHGLDRRNVKTNDVMGGNENSSHSKHGPMLRQYSTNIAEQIIVGVIDLLHNLRDENSADHDGSVRLRTFRYVRNT